MISLYEARKKRGRIIFTVIDEKDMRFGTFRVPVALVIGKRDGQTLFVDAAQHTEFQGAGAIKQILETINPAKVSGNIIFIPIMDTMIAKAMATKWNAPSEKITDTTNMHTYWPYGDKKTLKNKVKGIIYDEYLSKADAFVDIHCWTTACVPAITVYPDKKSVELAIATGYPTISIIENPKDKKSKEVLKHMSTGMQMSVPEIGVPGFTLESTNAPGGWLTKPNMDCVQRALENLMKYLKILPGAPNYVEETKIVSLYEDVLCAKKNGIVIPERRVGEIVKKGDALLSIYDIETFKPLEKIKAPMNGLFWSQTIFATAKKGDYVAHVKKIERIIKHK